MRAAVTSEPGAIAVSDVDDASRRSGEVLVQVRAASVNRLDRAVFDGTAMGGVARFPLVQGVDAAGVIVDGTGSMTTGLRVAVKPSIACMKCRWCRRGQLADCVDALLFGVHRQGGYAELLSVPRQNLAVLPDSVSFTAGAAAAHTHAVVLRMIRSAGDMPPGATMLVTGAGGALGTAAVQLGVALGLRVVAVASTAEKLEFAAGLGASVLVFRSEMTGSSTGVRSATDGVGADLVIETTGFGDVIHDAVGTLARGGRMVVVGASAGASLELDVLSLYRSRQAIIGSAGSNHDDFAAVYRLMGQHGIEPVIAGVHPLEDMRRAMDAVLERGRIGKVMIEMGADE